jgi:CMP/dCMP kinase
VNNTSFGYEVGFSSDRACSQIAMIVTIDGPAGAGKSTVAKAVAAKLGYNYLDTGALYRAVAWKALQTGTDPMSPAAMQRMLKDTHLSIEPSQSGGMAISIDGNGVTSEIRTPAVTRAASKVAAIPEVRGWLLPIQREFGKDSETHGLVAEGRDLGTRIFPDAEAKFFLKADPEERARRRQVELASSGAASNLDETHRDMAARDAQDETRKTAPLIPAADAIQIDSTGRSVEEVVAQMLGVIERKAAHRR